MEIKQFQRLMRDLYFTKDKDRGVERTFIWLIEEVGELASSLKNRTEKSGLEAVASEMADIFAWLCSLANVLEIDLEQAALKKYPLKCSKCKQNPCICTEH